jgi:hypothetical protein
MTGLPDRHKHLDVADCLWANDVGTKAAGMSSGVCSHTSDVLERRKLIMNLAARRFAFVVVLIIFAVLVSRPALAAMPLTTDDAYTVEKGIFQLEAAMDFIRQENHDKELSPSVILTYGLFERMDVAIGSAYLFLDPAEGKNENGLGDTEVKVKYHFIDQKDWIPHFAVSGTLKLPTATNQKG